MKYILAIDQSTSATKAILFDVRGGLVDKESRSHQQHYPRPGWVEHDAEEIFANTLAAIGDWWPAAAPRLRDIVCLSLTNQRETFVVFDRETGKPLHRRHRLAVPPRGSDLCPSSRQAGREDGIRRLTGLEDRQLLPRQQDAVAAGRPSRSCAARSSPARQPSARSTPIWSIA